MYNFIDYKIFYWKNLYYFFHSTKPVLKNLIFFKTKVYILYLYYGDSFFFYEQVLKLKKNKQYEEFFEIYFIHIGLYSYNSFNFINTNYTFFYNKKSTQVWYKIIKNFEFVINVYKNNFMAILNYLYNYKKKQSLYIFYSNLFNKYNDFYNESKKEFGSMSINNFLIINNINPNLIFQFPLIFFLKKLNILLSFNFNLFIYFYKFFKNFFLPFVIGFLFFYYSFFFFKLSFVKTIANWLGFSLFIFWLFSTFNFFIKRYRYAKYTSAIQRFWKRAFMCFWMIEGFLFIIFFYYLLNSSNEPYFMFDTYGLYINHLIVIKSFLFNSFLIILILNLFIFLLINIKFTIFKKNIFFLLLITIILIYLLFIESYQFYYLLNFYVDYIWIFSEDDNIWELEYDIPRTRNKNHYITLIVIAKFWHYIFIFISWTFFIIKLLELNRIRYSFLSMNFQNIILFYIMNWLCLYSWLKWLIRRFIDQTYYWFFTSFRPITINIIFSDLINYFNNLLIIQISLLKNKLGYLFYYLFNSNLYIIYNPNSFFKNFFTVNFIF